MSGACWLLGRSSLPLARGRLVGIVVVVGLECIGLGPLELEQEGGVLDLDQVVDVLQARLHQLHLRLDGVVAVSDACAHNLLRAGKKLAG